MCVLALRVLASRRHGALASLLGFAWLASACASIDPPRADSASNRRDRTSIRAADDRLQADDRRVPVSAVEPAITPAALPDEPLFEVGRPLERAALVAAVLERNPSLAAVREILHAARSRPAQDAALDDPMLALGLAPLSFGSRKVDPAGRVELAQPLPFPGKRRLRGEAAHAEAEAAAQDLESARLELAALASQRYDAYALAERALEINREHVQLVDDLRRLALARYAAGRGDQQSVLQAEMALARAHYERSELEAARAIVVEQLDAMLHRTDPRPLPPPPAPIEAAASSLDPAAPLVEQALARRPELAATDARERAAAARVDLARLAYLPDFTVVGAYEGLMQATALGPFVGVRLDVPLQLGRRRAALDESRARLATLRHRRTALEDEIRLAARTAALRLEQAREAERIVREQLVPAANDQVATARAAYATGGSTFLVLIDAVRELHDAQLEHAQTLTRIAQRRAALDRALGRMPGLEG